MNVAATHSPEDPELEAVLAGLGIRPFRDVLPERFLTRHGLVAPGQYGLACADVGAAVARAEALGAGPFLRAKIPAPSWIERGEKLRAAQLDFALGYAGRTQIEFLGPGRGTSFYRDALEGREIVLHHAGIYQKGMAQLAASLEGAGHALAVRGGTSFGDLLSFDFRYFDTRDALGFYIEVLDFQWGFGRVVNMEHGIRLGARLSASLRR